MSSKKIVCFCFSCFSITLLSVTSAVMASEAVTADSDTTQNYEEQFKNAANEVNVNVDLAKAVAQVESRHHPWTLNIAGRSFFFDTKEEALAAAERAKAAGKSFDTGIMQVNNWWLKRYDIPLETALDPTANILLGSWILKQALNQHPDDKWAGVGKYHSPNASRGERYAAQVRQALERGPVGSGRPKTTGKSATDLANAKKSGMKPGKGVSGERSRKFNQQVADQIDAPLVVYVKPKPIFQREAPTEESREEARKKVETAEETIAANEFDSVTRDAAREKTVGEANSFERAREEHAQMYQMEPEIDMTHRQRDSLDNEIHQARVEAEKPVVIKSKINDEELVPAVLVRNAPGRKVFMDAPDNSYASREGKSEFVRRMQ